MVFRVDKKQSKNRFVLYYQEFNDEYLPHLRKIKLKLNDVSKIKHSGLNYIGKKDNIVRKDLNKFIISRLSLAFILFMFLFSFF